MFFSLRPFLGSIAIDADVTKSWREVGVSCDVSQLLHCLFFRSGIQMDQVMSGTDAFLGSIPTDEQFYDVSPGAS